MKIAVGCSPRVIVLLDPEKLPEVSLEARQEILMSKRTLFDT